MELTCVDFSCEEFFFEWRMFTFLIILPFVFLYPTFFMNRIFTIGYNKYLKLCSINEGHFYSSSKKLIENYPGEETEGKRENIVEIANTVFNSFFRTIEGGSIFWGKQPNDSAVACRGGYCNDYDTCVCDECYEGEYCQVPYCFDILANDSAVCNGKGDCVDCDTCSCHVDQEGVSENCTYPTCFGVEVDDDDVCSGHMENAFLPIIVLVMMRVEIIVKLSTT